MAMTQEEMKAAARTIRDETGEGRNTAYRVGTLLLEMVGALAQGGGTAVYGIAATRGTTSVIINLLDAEGNVASGAGGTPLSVAIPSADALGAGFMSKADKAKLDQLEAGGGTTYEVFGVGKAGLVPAPAAAAETYLRSDGNWAVPAGGTTYEVFTSAKAGLVPAPGSSAYTRFLRSDGIWVNPQPVLAFGGVVSGVTVEKTSTTGSGFTIVYDKDNDRFLRRYGLAGAYKYYYFNTDNWAQYQLGDSGPAIERQLYCCAADNSLYVCLGGKLRRIATTAL